jgi:hypothetical protein
MWFNSKQREEPYQPLTWWSRKPEMDSFSSAGPHTGVAWLSSARVVRCWVKSRNERNPHPYLPAVRPGTIRKLPVINRRKVGTMSSLQRDAIRQRGANPQKISQFGLVSATRDHEVGITSNRGSACRGEYVLGPCTHCPSRHGSWFYLKVAS